jgi:hypothetical protein
VVLLSLCARAAAQNGSPAESTDLDAFMKAVLAQRDVNRQTLEQYVLDERERIEVLGPGRLPLWRTTREFRWYVREGLHVRSPLRFDGVEVSNGDRRAYEDRWSRRERERLERRKEQKDEDGSDVPPDPRPAPPAGATPIPTPRFVSEAYFLDFKFEPGNYLLAGRETLEGREVLRIEYYPKRLFSDDDNGRHGRQDDEHRRHERDRDRELEDRIDRQMNKTALVTLWVDPSEHQIVKYTFDNVWMDFLPGAWLVRVDDIHASMTMGQPFPGVWLPRMLNLQGAVTLANGTFEANYERLFADYRQADVKTKVRIPGVQGSRFQVPGSAFQVQGAPAARAGANARARSAWAWAPRRTERSREPANSSSEATGLDDPPHHGPFAGDDDGDAQPGESIAEIRVHGNAFLPDEEVIRLADVAIGAAVGPQTLLEIEQRLKRSGRFESVEVRKRLRSLTSTSEVVIVLVVHERPGVTASSPKIVPVARPWRRFTSRLMFLPILDYADGYGFTYGGRLSTVDFLGLEERLSVPLTWGGTRRAALEFERTFSGGPLTLVRSSVGIWQRENPRFEIDDQRVEVTARAERHFARVVRTGFDASRSSIEFGSLNDPMWTIGADAALDTRGDPSFPRNAILLRARWAGLRVRDGDRINRYTTDARGYLGLLGQLVLAGRVVHVAADAPLPPYERLLVGGADTLRGFRAGAFDGDRSLAASAELRLPITSVLSGAKFGVTAFMDAATAYDYGRNLDDAEWHRGVGGGVFLIAPFVKINLDVARGLKSGDTRVHLATGFAF